MDITNGVDMTIKIKEGITFNDFDTRENDMYLIDRSAPTPSEKEIIESVPFAHGVYDFSNILGERIFNNRTISYTFHIHEHDYDRRKHDQTVLENKLLGTHITRLEDSYDPSYYYLAKCVSVNTTDDHVYNRLVVTADFDCYPFKISKLKEGHDIWDEFNFELDVAQEMQYAMDGEYTFKQLPIGSTATIGAWATTYASGGGKIPMGNIGVSGTITGMEYVESSRSKRAYNVTGIDGLVVEQDIIQAHIEPLEITLINAGTPSVTPKLNLTAKATIVKGNRSYNFLEGGQYESGDFRLDSGENKLKIYSFHENKIEFDFHKELI